MAKYVTVIVPSIHPSIAPWAQRPQVSNVPSLPHLVSFKTALVSWAFTRVGVHRLYLCPPCLSVFPFTLHLPLNFICGSSLRLMYLHPSVDLHLLFFGEFLGLGLALVPDVVIPEADNNYCYNLNNIMLITIRTRIHSSACSVHYTVLQEINKINNRQSEQEAMEHACLLLNS